MTMHTIEYVQPEAREWDNPKGENIFFVTVNFEDGSEGSTGFTKAKLEEGLASLRALKDQAVDFELEDKGEFNGTKQWKIKSYPGRPAGGWSGGGGSGGGGGGMTHAQVGFLAAATVLGPVYGAQIPEAGVPTNAILAADIMELGELLIQALYDRKPPAREGEATAPGTEAGREPASAPSPPPAAGDVPTLAQMKTLKDIASSRGQTPEEFALALGVTSLAAIPKADAAELIEQFAGASA